MAYLDVTRVVEAKLLFLEYEEEDGTLKPVLAIPDGKGYMLFNAEIGGRKLFGRASQQLARNADLRRGIPVGAESSAVMPETALAAGHVMGAVGSGSVEPL